MCKYTPKECLNMPEYDWDKTWNYFTNHVTFIDT